jgi:hypothetical protein
MNEKLFSISFKHFQNTNSVKNPSTKLFGDDLVCTSRVLHTIWKKMKFALGCLAKRWRCQNKGLDTSARRRPGGPAEGKVGFSWVWEMGAIWGTGGDKGQNRGPSRKDKQCESGRKKLQLEHYQEVRLGALRQQEVTSLKCTGEQAANSGFSTYGLVSFSSILLLLFYLKVQ